MQTIAYGIGGLVGLFVVAVLLLFPAYEGLPPGWVIVAVMFGIPLVGMAVRRLLGRD